MAAKKSLKILAIETSCDETAAAVIEGSPRSEGNPRIKSNALASQAKIHGLFGGVVPEVAARNHVPAIIPLIELALSQAKVKLKEIDYIAVTQGPGLITSLMVGVETARTLGLVLRKPVLPINHLEAHIYASFVEKKIRFPALILTVSGGHTMLVLMKAHGNFKILGETLDDAAGEAFDKSARLLGLSYPGGANLSKLARNGSPLAFDFPRPMIKKDNLSFSFSGLKTAVFYEVIKHKKLTAKLKADIAASTQQAIVESLLAKLNKAIKKFRPKTIMLGGGVAANKLLRKEFVKSAKNHKIRYSIPKPEYCTDNAAMIGLAAYYRLRNKKIKADNRFDADPQLVLK